MCICIYNVCKHHHTDDRSDSDHGHEHTAADVVVDILPTNPKNGTALKHHSRRSTRAQVFGCSMGQVSGIRLRVSAFGFRGFGLEVRFGFQGSVTFLGPGHSRVRHLRLYCRVL